MTGGSERFLRIQQLLGRPAVQRLHRARVTVVGLGAVGSYATEALARAGVGHLRLVDFDVVRRSNINRQLYALESTVGRLKIDVAAERVRDISPACVIEPLACFVHTDTMDSVLAGPPDLVVDAIDALNPKVELLIATRQRSIPVVSSMGAALRTDPTMIRTGPLGKSHHCPLAAMIRRRLRRRGAGVDFPCVYSIEPPPPAADEPMTADEAVVGPEEAPDTYIRGRARRTLGSLPTITGIFGLTVANEALRILLGGSFPVQRD